MGGAAKAEPPIRTTAIIEITIFNIVFNINPLLFKNIMKNLLKNKKATVCLSPRGFCSIYVNRLQQGADRYSVAQ
jgi:hypothetical protein